MNHIKFISCAFILSLALAGCSGAKETLGLERKSPDEFAVVKRAPLEMPPGYDLRPPAPGAPRAQEQAPGEQAKAVVFGSEAQAAPAKPSSSEELFLEQAGALSVDADIRSKVDAEAKIEDNTKKPVVKRILNIGGGGKAPATVVNAPKELERLQKNAEEGKPVTDGESPSIED